MMTPEQAFDEYHEAVFAFACRLVRRPDRAEDITQETFLALLRAPQRFDPARGSMRVYLFSIARHLALKHFRDTAVDAPLDDDPAGHPAVQPVVDPRRALDAGVAVEAAVAGLPILQREALILFEYTGATLEDIARITGADIGVVKSRLHRAREGLRKVLAPYRSASVSRHLPEVHEERYGIV